MTHLYRVSTIAKDHFEQAGRHREHAENELNQMMSSAKMAGINGDYRIFENAKKEWRLFLHKTEKIIEDVARIEVETETPEIHGMFKLLPHALKRARERFGFPQMSDSQVENHVNQALKVATWQSETKGKQGMLRHYNAINQNMRIVVDMKTREIVTLYTLDVVTKPPINALDASSPLFATVVATVKRELAKARRKFNRESKALQVAIADATIELAKAQRNFVRAKAPHVKTIIRQRIEDYARNIDAMQADLERKKSEFERTQADGKALVAGGER